MIAAALAIGETVARACHVGKITKKRGRRMLAEIHAFLARRAEQLLPFSSQLAERLKEVAPPGYL